MHAPLLVVSPPDHAAHDTGGHPERSERIDAVLAGIDDVHLGDALARSWGRDATRDELLRVHDARYVDALEAFAQRGGGRLDPDTVVAPGSFDAARRAAGSGLAAVDALEAGEADAAFVVIRPPGHHAVPDRGQGFCLFNNIAIAARTLVDRGERVLVVDWDVHHGNGTQDVFWNDPSVLFASVHQFPLYPGTGRAEETGGPDAPGLTVNVPLPPGATGDVAVAALDELVGPAAARFDPTWVLVSAGFDAHRADPLAALQWSAGDFGVLARRVVQLTPARSRVVAFLEGGYDLDALRASAALTAAALAGAPGKSPDGEAPTAGGPGIEALGRTRSALSETG